MHLLRKELTHELNLDVHLTEQDIIQDKLL